MPSNVPIVRECRIVQNIIFVRDWEWTNDPHVYVQKPRVIFEKRAGEKMFEEC